MAQKKKGFEATKVAQNKPNVVKTSPIIPKAQPKAAVLALPTEPIWVKYAPYLWIFGVCFAVYIQSVKFQFTGLDDSFFLVVYQQYFADFNNFWRGFKESGVLDYYRPILFGSLIFDFQFTKTDPFFYHVTNIIYHLIGCWALYNMLIKLKFEKLFALLTTLIFAAHPMWAMAVAWVPGRNDPMITMMAIGAFNFLINYMQRGGFINLIAHWFLFGLSLYTKETSAMFPFICCAYFLLLTPWKDKIKEIMTVGVGWAIIGLVWFAIRAEALELANKNGTRFTSIIYGSSWIQNLPDWPEYIGKFTIPMNLSNFPKFSIFSTATGCAIIATWIILLFLAKKRNDNLILFFVIWILMFFGPATIFIFADSGRYDYLEHRFHTPAIAFVVFANELIRSFFAVGGRDHLKKYFYYGLSAVVVIFGIYCIIHSWNFANPKEFWKKAIEGAPESSQVYRGMGKVYYDEGDLPNAEKIFMKAVELNRAEINTISDIGKQYEAKGDIVSAERCFRKTLEIDSNQVVFIADMARIYEKQRKLPEAERMYRRAIALNPTFWQARFGLGILCFQKGNMGEAEANWLEVVKLNPSYNDTYINLSVLYFRVNRFDKAIEWVDKLSARGVDVQQLNPGLYNELNKYRK